MTLAEDLRHAMTAAYHLGFAHAWAAAAGDDSLVEGWQTRDDQLDSLIRSWQHGVARG